MGQNSRLRQTRYKQKQELIEIAQLMARIDAKTRELREQDGLTRFQALVAENDTDKLCQYFDENYGIHPQLVRTELKTLIVGELRDLGGITDEEYQRRLKRGF